LPRCIKRRFHPGRYDNNPGTGGDLADRHHSACLRKAHVAQLIDANVKLAPTISLNPSVTSDLDAEPATVGISALRVLAGLLASRR